MQHGIEEVINALYDMVNDAWSVPLGADKVVVERDKILDLLDEISSQLPGELKQSRTIVESRNELIANARKEAAAMMAQAEAKARQMLTKEQVYIEAQKEAAELVNQANLKVKELRQVTNEYVDDALKRTEDTVNEALARVRDSRQKFNTMTGVKEKKATAIIEDI
ncbi:MAG: hypothetical protein R3Y62_04650 [Eubacteriales bacterium]